MSHFAILVIGGEIEKQLQPYHEFECTGTNDEYVQDIDITNDARAEFEEGTETRLRAPDGTLHSYFDESGNWRPEFSQPDPNRPSSDNDRRARFVPEGYEQVKVPVSQVESFAGWIKDCHGLNVVPFGQEPDKDGEHRYGYVLVDEAGEVTKAVDRTNPNKKWDWWVVGGRWSGFLKLKDGATGAIGRKGLMGSCADDGPDRADQATKVAIDFEGMRDQAGQKAAESWDQAEAAHGGQTWLAWPQVRDEKHPGNIEAARDEYNAQPAVQALRKLFDHPFHDLDQYLTPRDEFIQQARDSATVPYAIVKDGEWIAKGEMGWFGISNNTENQADWNRKVNEMLDALPDDTLITVVDCHI